MLYALACVCVLGLAHLSIIVHMSVFNHRGLTHSGVKLTSWVRWVVLNLGICHTQMDSVVWVGVHKIHHKHSDTPEDSHSPHNGGLWAVWKHQIKAFLDVRAGLANRDPKYLAAIEHLGVDGRMHLLSRHGEWWLLPYAIHVGIGLCLIGWWWGMWAMGVCYTLGMLSHAIQGFIVNSLGHADGLTINMFGRQLKIPGHRNFNTDDRSFNVGWRILMFLLLGEVLQNNHHAYERSAKFSLRDGEFDPGFALCRLFAWLGLMEIDWTQVHKAEAGWETRRVELGV